VNITVGHTVLIVKVKKFTSASLSQPLSSFRSSAKLNHPEVLSGN